MATDEENPLNFTLSYTDVEEFDTVRLTFPIQAGLALYEMRMGDE